MSLSSIMARTFLLGGMAVGLCCMSLGVAAPAHSHPELKKITAAFSGSVSPSGAVEDNSSGKIIGEVDRAGVVYNNKGAVVGSVDDKGIVHDAKGVPVAQVSLKNRLAGVAYLLEK